MELFYNFVSSGFTHTINIDSKYFNIFDENIICTRM